MIPPMVASVATDQPVRSERFSVRGVDVLAIVAFWSLLAVVSGVSRQLDPRIPGIPGRMAAAAAAATYVEYAIWAVLTIPIFWMTSRYAIEGGRRVGRVLLFVGLGFVLALIVDSILLDVREQLMSGIGPFRRRPPPPLIVGLGILDDLMVYFAILGAGVARDYFLRYQARLEETARLQALLTQARLDALRAQLNPHFLFNTLNAISALVERDPRGVRRMIARLSDLLRYTLDESSAQEVPLSRELDMLAEYIDLMQIRFQGKLNVGLAVDDAARRALVPSLILQPIVENAIKHGVGRLTGAGDITIEARCEGAELRIRVHDTGPGLTEHTADDGAGVGLANTTARLRQMYGPAYGATLHAGPNGTGAVAELLLPFRDAPAVEGVA
jgi:two-component system, LytTR family, sensor kinase